MTYLVIPDDDFGIDELMLMALLCDYFKERNVIPILKSAFRAQHWDLEEPSVPILPTIEPYTDTRINKKGKIIQDNTPFYNKFARAGHKRR